MPAEYMLIDAKDKIMGRLAAYVAKLALLGRNVVVINAKDCVISGDKESIFKHYIYKRQIKTRTRPLQGPFFYRPPERIFRRTVRGMLPFKQPHGREAYKRVHVYPVGPEEGRYPKLVPHDVPNVGKERLMHSFVTLEKLSNRFGWQNVE